MIKYMFDEFDKIGFFATYLKFNKLCNKNAKTAMIEQDVNVSHTKTTHS